MLLSGGICDILTISPVQNTGSAVRPSDYGELQNDESVLLYVPAICIT